MSKISRCEGCQLLQYGLKPHIHSRWDGARLVYYWVECGDTPPCKTGPTAKTQKEAVDGWNLMAKKPRPAEASDREGE